MLSGGFIEAPSAWWGMSRMNIQYPPVLSGGFIEAGDSHPYAQPELATVSPGVIRGLH